MHINHLYFTPSIALVAATGADAADLLHRLSTQNTKLLAQPANLSPVPTALPKGEMQARALLLVNHQGRLVSKATALSGQGYLTLVTRAGGGGELCEWLLQYTITEDAKFSVTTEHNTCWRLLASLPAALDLPSSRPPQPSATWAELAEVLAPLGATWWPAPQGWGEGYDVVLPQAAVAIAAAKLSSMGVLPATSDGLFERARILIGEPAWERDYAPLCPPLEWRLGQDTIDWHKGCFVGQEVLSRLDSYNKVARLVMGLEAGAEAAALCASGRPLKVLRDGTPIGRLASFALLPTATSAKNSAPTVVALALVRKETAVPGPCELIDSEAPNAPRAAATLLDRPFWQASPRRQ